MKTKYPRLKQISLKVRDIKGISYVDRDELKQKLIELKITTKFSDLFGVQTQIMEGPYASDVEDVLERIFSGKRTGSQLFWD